MNSHGRRHRLHVASTMKQPLGLTFLASEQAELDLFCKLFSVPQQAV